MAWVVTNEQPRFRELAPGMIFSFCSGKTEEDRLQGWWIRTQDPADPHGGCNAVRLTDGSQYLFKDGDPVEPAFGARVMT